LTVLDERQASAFLGLSVHTLRKWRQLRRGPRFVKLPGAERRGRGAAGRVLYREPDLLAYLEEMTVPTENPMPERLTRRIFGV
jgi:hypothetical protein